MLEWLDVESVAWGRYHHAYGPATDVPDLLRALAAPSQASKWIRRRADKAKKPVLQHVVWALWGNLFHQGSVRDYLQDSSEPASGGALPRTAGSGRGLLKP